MSESTYNPIQPFATLGSLHETINLNIDRHPEDEGRHWHECYRLIENYVCHDREVVQAAMDPGEELLYVALRGETYDLEELEAIDVRLRKLIGKVASFYP